MASKPKRPRRGTSGEEHPILLLQRQAGNAAVSKLVPGLPPGVDVLAYTIAQLLASEPDIAWIEQIPSHIQEQIDMFSQNYLSKQTPAKQKELLGERNANRITFMHTMGKFLGSYDAVEAHYREIKPMPGTQLWAHVSTRERLLEVQEDLKAQGSPMPETDVALGLRGDHLHPEGKSGGWYTHAAGFAIDWKAYAAPHIKDERLNALFETITGGPTYFDLGLSPAARIALIEKMGQGKADKAEADKFLDKVDAEYDRLKQGSDKFKTDLPETSLAPLREVEAARTAVSSAQYKLAQLRKRGARKDAIEEAADELSTAQADFDEKLKNAQAHLKEIFEPWTKKLDARIEAINQEAADKGVDLEKLSGQFKFKELNDQLHKIQAQEASGKQTARRVLADVLSIQRQLMLLSARIAAARAWLDTHPPAGEGQGASVSGALDDLEQQIAEVNSSLEPVKSTLGTLLPGATVEPAAVPAQRPQSVSDRSVAALADSLKPLPDRVTKAAATLDPVIKPLTDLVGSETAVKQEIAERTQYRAEASKRLGGATVEDLLQKKTKIIALKAAKEALETDAAGFVFKARDVRDPAITQLLGMQSGTQGGGFFTPQAESGGEEQAKKNQWSGEHGFNKKFFRSMVSHGFELGVAWTGMADTMHFELAEGRQLLQTAGKEPLVAGGKLRAAELKAAAGSSAKGGP